LKTVGHAAFSERIGRKARFASIGNGLTAGVMGFAGSYFAPVSIFWLTAVLTLPALLSLFLVGAERAETSVANGTGGEAPGPDDGRITWKGVKGLFLDRRLLTFTVCMVLFFVSRGR
jgi:hypothetical protein